MSSDEPPSDIAHLAIELRSHVEDLTDEVVAKIIAEVEVYRIGALLSHVELRQAVLGNVTSVLDNLTHRGPIDVTATARTGRERAEQDVPLPEVLRTYRLGFALIWQRLLDIAHRSGTSSTDALLASAAEIWQRYDEYTLALTEAYRHAMGERLVALDRHRSALVAALVGGHDREGVTMWEIARLLNMPFEGTFLVVVAETPSLAADALPHVEERLRAIDVATAWRRHPDHDVGLVSLGKHQTPEAVLKLIRNGAVGRVGVSPVFTRLDEANRFIRLAQVALESLPAGAPGVGQLAGTALEELLTGNRDATYAFVTRVLGGVLALPEDERNTLLHTAEVWLDSGGSVAAAGRVLYCHENTVRYRLKRLEEHLGVTLDNMHNMADLATALRALATFPELANRAAGGTRGSTHTSLTSS